MGIDSIDTGKYSVYSGEIELDKNALIAISSSTSFPIPLLRHSGEGFDKAIGLVERCTVEKGKLVAYCKIEVGEVPEQHLLPALSLNQDGKAKSFSFFHFSNVPGGKIA